MHLHAGDLDDAIHAWVDTGGFGVDEDDRPFEAQRLVDHEDRVRGATVN
jgi:hypothetical protein